MTKIQKFDQMREYRNEAKQQQARSIMLFSKANDDKATLSLARMCLVSAFEARCNERRIQLGLPIKFPPIELIEEPTIYT